MIENKQKIFSKIVFGVYFILLVWLVLFKFSLSFDDIESVRKINLIPFYYDQETPFHFSEVLYNILVFLPLGVYVTIFFPHSSFVKRTGICLFVSFSFEVIQYIAMIGASDITDLLTNGFGGMLGIGLYCGINRLCKEKTIWIINLLGFLVEIVAIILLSILIFVNFS